MNLQSPITSGGRIYKIFARRLEKLGITNFEGFLYHIPFRYDDFSYIVKTNKVKPGQIATIQGIVSSLENVFTKNYKRIQKAEIADSSGTIEVIWFNQPFLTKVIHAQDKIALSGKIEWFNRRLTMQSPEYELINNLPLIHTSRIVPVYPETRGITSKWLRRQTFKLINENNFAEFLPDETIKNYSLMEFSKAIKEIHFPDDLENVQKARHRLSFDELFLLQLSSMKRRQDWNKNLIGNKLDINVDKINKFIESLPFKLTNAQQKVVTEILNDLKKDKPMNRLLEGDVGSGKTVVGAIAMYVAFLNGFQSVLMAPTEILATQHFNTVSKLLSPFRIKVDLATGSIKTKNKKQKTKIDILVGTHAVLEKNIKFDNLGLIIIDEQQRFGVEQRAIIKNKGKNPHLLTMTATPIPRTIALTMYGDLDLSILDEMPFGRKQIKTWLVPQEKRFSGYDWIKKQISQTKSQVFIVCPFIEESESMQAIKAAKKEFEDLQKNIFKDLKLGLLHGKMKAKEKDEILNKFRDGKIDILVATPVVEVGIDIPNATIIVIEAAERFGLAQLHQLRGRVGRGDKQSYCLLFTESQNPMTQTRLKAMEKHNIGATLAELDLKLRGPGEIYGTMQHGRNALKIANFFDFDLISKTKREAEKVFPNLQKFPKLLEKLNSINLKQISQD